MFENPADTKKFRIIRIIEWESRDKEIPWRKEISGSYGNIQ
ncbi:hypothetical protein [Brucepastera parasyntrophica]|nr:hypothetical protein [Brucepastera parasyntrophica]